MEKLHILHGGIMMTSMNIFGLFLKNSKFPRLLHCFICILICYICRSPACFELRWPMRKESPFLLKPKKWKRVRLTVTSAWNLLMIFVFLRHLNFCFNIMRDVWEFFFSKFYTRTLAWIMVFNPGNGLCACRPRWWLA